MTGRTPRAHRATTILLYAALLVPVLTASVSAKRKDDRLVMENGDQFIGEIKKLEYGELYFKGDYMLNSMQVDWSRVSALQSQDSYQVVLQGGRDITGRIERFADGRFTITEAGATPQEYRWYNVVSILPVETTFWAQLTGNLNSGFSYTSGESQTQFTASGAVGYVANTYTVGISGSSVFAGEPDGSHTVRNTIDGLTTFKRRDKWFTLAFVGLLQSDQQNLTLRSTWGGGVGRILKRTGRTDLNAYAGLVYTHEQYNAPIDPTQPASEIQNNLESVFGLTFHLYRFKTTDITSNFTVFPSLSTPGRYRLNYAPTLNFEIARNLYWSFTLYENYDSKPPVSANKNDFGITNSIGWKF